MMVKGKDRKQAENEFVKEKLDKLQELFDKFLAEKHVQLADKMRNRIKAHMKIVCLGLLMERNSEAKMNRFSRKVVRINKELAKPQKKLKFKRTITEMKADFLTISSLRSKAKREVAIEEYFGTIVRRRVAR